MPSRISRSPGSASGASVTRTVATSARAALMRLLKLGGFFLIFVRMSSISLSSAAVQTAFVEDFEALEFHRFWKNVRFRSVISFSLSCRRKKSRFGSGRLYSTNEASTTPLPETKTLVTP